MKFQNPKLNLIFESADGLAHECILPPSAFQNMHLKRFVIINTCSK